MFFIVPDPYWKDSTGQIKSKKVQKLEKDSPE